MWQVCDPAEAAEMIHHSFRSFLKQVGPLQSSGRRTIFNIR